MLAGGLARWQRTDPHKNETGTRGLHLTFCSKTSCTNFCKNEPVCIIWDCLDTKNTFFCYTKITITISCHSINAQRVRSAFEIQLAVPPGSADPLKLICNLHLISILTRRRLKFTQWVSWLLMDHDTRYQGSSKNNIRLVCYEISRSWG